LYDVELVYLALAGEQRLPVNQLPHDAADRPHVHRFGVRGGAEQDLRRAVPERHHLVGVGAHGDAEGTGETEIRQLEGPVAVNEQVLRLQITVQNAMRVAVCDALKHLDQNSCKSRTADALTLIGACNSKKEARRNDLMATGTTSHAATTMARVRKGLA